MTHGWWKYAKVGQNVVCIKRIGEWANPWPAEWVPKYGDVCEIAAIHVDDWFTHGIGFELKGWHGRFGVIAFRPLIDEERISRRVAEIIRNANAPAHEREREGV